MSEPTRSRPHIPGYGIPEDEEGMLPWSFVLERIATPRNYMRHGTPVWAVQPQVVFAWTTYPTTVTRWRFT